MQQRVAQTSPKSYHDWQPCMEDASSPVWKTLVLACVGVWACTKHLYDFRLLFSVLWSKLTSTCYLLLTLVPFYYWHGYVCADPQTFLLALSACAALHPFAVILAVHLNSTVSRTLGVWVVVRCACVDVGGIISVRPLTSVGNFGNSCACNILLRLLNWFATILVWVFVCAHGHSA